MKKNIVIYLFLLLCSLHSLADETIQKKSFEEICKQAEKEKKYVLLFFTGSDWCVSCRLLEKQVLLQPTFLKYATKHLLLYNADFPRKKKEIPKEQQIINEQLFDKYNTKGTFPTCVILMPTQEIIGILSGYKTGTTESFIKKIDQIIQSTSK